MAVSVVNGYLCTTSYDVAKAQGGENPRHATDPVQDSAIKNDDAASSKSSSTATSDGPAVTFGGALSDPSGPDAVQPVDQAQPADAANWWNRKHTVDMLV